MTAQEFLNEWSTKYPKSYRKFIDYYDAKYYRLKTDIMIQIEISYLSFEMLIGVIENFFEQNNLFISIDYCELGWKYCIKNLECKLLSNDRKFHALITKKEAQQSAYLKSAEILEERL